MWGKPYMWHVNVRAFYNKYFDLLIGWLCKLLKYNIYVCVCLQQGEVVVSVEV